MRTPWFFITLSFLVLRDTKAWQTTRSDDFTGELMDEELSLSKEWLSVIEFGLAGGLEAVRNWQKEDKNYEELERQMETAMDAYKKSRSLEDAAKVMGFVDKVMEIDNPFWDREKAINNAVFIARDRTGLPNVEKPSKSFSWHEEFGEKFGRFMARVYLARGGNSDMLGWKLSRKAQG